VRITAYAYPWDFARLGVERMVRQAADDGVEAIDLAASYHPIDSISPRDGVRLFSDPRGAIYFPARAERYGRIKPYQRAPEISAAWPQTANYASKLGLGLNAWTITLFSPWIRDAHPECARVLPGGDRSGSGLCPANEDVREFFATLCEDAADQFDVALFRLESVLPLYDFDWLRPRVIVSVPPLARTLLNLCFCGACIRKGAASGLDVERVRRTANDAISCEITEGQSEAGAARAVKLSEDAELKMFASNFIQSTTDFVRTIAERLKGRARLSVNTTAPFTMLLGSEAEDALLRELIGAADQLAIHPGVPDNARFTEIALRLSTPREISALIPLVRSAGSSGPALHAPVSGPEKTAQQAQALGASELSLYNIGLIRPEAIPEFITAFRRGQAVQ
jgi:hypothetical protein